MTEPTKSHIGVADYAIFVGSLLLFLGIGVFFAVFKKRSNRALLSGEQNMTLLPIVFSLVGGSMSGLSVLGFPAEIYSYGTLFSEFCVAQLVFIPLMTSLFLPTFYKWQFPNIFKYLDIRFKFRGLRIITLIFFITDTFVYLAAVIFAPSLAISAVTDIPMWTAILCMGGSVSIYTAIGGFQAVVWIEFIQTLILLAGMLAILIQGILQVGGLDNALQIAKDHGRLDFLDFRLDPFIRQTSLTIFFGQGFFWGGIFALNPPHVLRFCSMKSMKSVKRGIIFSVLLLSSFMILICLCGLVIFATYADCDPLAQGRISRPDQIVPFFVVDKLGNIPGLLGLFMAALFSGVLSSVSCTLNAIIGIIWEDFVKPCSAVKNLTEQHQAKMIKALVFVGGLLPMGFSFFLGSLGAILTVALTFNGAVRGGISAMFVLGMFVPWVEKKGAMLGFLVSEVFMVWLGAGSLVYRSSSPPLQMSTLGCSSHEELGKNAAFWLSINGTNQESKLDWPAKIYTVSYIFYPVLGLILAISAAIPFSYFFGKRYGPEELEGVVYPCILRWYKRLYQRQHMQEEKDLIKLNSENETFQLTSPNVKNSEH